MKEVGEKYEALLERIIASSCPKIPFYSTVLNTVIKEKGVLDSAYWRKNLESPVLFNTTMKALLADHKSNNLFLEIGPHSALAGPLRQILKKQQPEAIYISTLSRGGDDTQSLLTALGNLFLKGIPVDLGPLNQGGKIATGLPSYPWNREETFWEESRISREWRMRKFPRHDLLGTQVVEGSAMAPTWRNVLSLDDAPWIRDHMVNQDIVFPGAGYVAMAGEALRQVTGAEDFTVRNLTVKAAMIVHEHISTEIVSSLRPYRLTNSLDSTWYEFIVYSHNRSNWTKHCSGQVTQGEADSKAVSDAPSVVVDLPRKVSSARWYQAFSKVCIKYGPMFRGLHNLSAHPVDHRAVATVGNYVNPDDSPYQLHPTTMDFALQLFSVAAYRAQPREFVRMLLPSYFGEIYMKRPASNTELKLSSDASVTARGAIRGDAFGTVGDQVVMKLRDVHLVPAADDSAADTDPHAGVRLQWKPDIAYLDATNLIRTKRSIQSSFSIVQRLLLLCSIESTERLADLPPSAVAHLNKFRTWLSGHVQQAIDEGYEGVDDASSLYTLSSAERLELINETANQVANSDSAPLGKAIMQVFENCVDIFTGKADALDLLMQDEIMRKTYDLLAGFWDFSDFLGLLRHKKPNLKILEVGAGTGASTAVILDSLLSGSGERTFQSYTYTDISAGFFVQAKERFKNVPGMEYSVLDVSKDPAKQGFELEAYDLVIATNVLHATEYIGETLFNVRKLLQPEGKLILQELCSSTKWFNFIVGVLPGWWLGDKKISLLSSSSTSSVAIRLSKSLVLQGYQVEFCSLADAPKPKQDIISILDLEGKPFLEKVPEDEFAFLQNFISGAISSGMLWLTKSAQMGTSEPQYAQILGLARCVRNELSIDFATLEIDDVEDDNTFERVVQVVGKFQTRNKDMDVGLDFEYAISKGVVHVPRYHWISVSNELSSTKKTDAPKTLEIGKRGALKTLGWVERPQSKLIGDEMYIKIHAAGVNFKDVLIAMGIVDGNLNDGSGLGCECAGVVTEVGPEATFNVGDRVAIVLIQSACGGIGIAAIHICRMIGAEVFATVGSDEKVAYQMETFNIPQNRIFNSRDSSFLPGIMRETNGYGVDVVLNSLSGDLLHASWKCLAEFGKMLEIGRRDFVGQGNLPMDPFEANRIFYGVDLALYVEKRPLTFRSMLDRAMEWCSQGLIHPIRPVKSFDAHEIEDALRSMQGGQHIGKFVIKFPDDHTKLPASRGTNRIFLRPDVSYLLVGGLGGLGLSVSTWMVEHGARHFIYLSRSGDKGKKDAAFAHEMQVAGCTVEITAGSVINKADVQKVIAQAKYPIAGILQMSMVLNDASFPIMTHEEWQNAVLPKIDGTWNLHEVFASQPLDFFVLFSSFAGLVGHMGQSNYASANTFLDAFAQFRHSQGLPASVLDISVIEDVGWVSQEPARLERMKSTAAYCLKEKDLLDALGLAIYKSTPHNQEAKTGVAGYVNESQIGIGLRTTMPIALDANRCIWKRDIRMSQYQNLEDSSVESSNSSNDGLRQFLASVTANPEILHEDASITSLAEEIGATLYSFLMKPIEELDITEPLASLGLDSLVAIELRNWSRQKLGVELNVLQIMGASSIKKLGQTAAQGLLVKLGVVVKENGH
ncbi:KR-domain-containing protein [Periconia macrospinosa]|uniref:KR-domain-containing protein n=1 Tax=Periconia macrospinosa TaxID=97972 RepID=A0A2V1D7Y8_9PLEO|nr:KR-domain-containing protein [Periconia macrospinosa]